MHLLHPGNCHRTPQMLRGAQSSLQPRHAAPWAEPCLRAAEQRGLVAEAACIRANAIVLIGFDEFPPEFRRNASALEDFIPANFRLQSQTVYRMDPHRQAYLYSAAVLGGCSACQELGVSRGHRRTRRETSRCCQRSSSCFPALTHTWAQRGEPAGSFADHCLKYFATKMPGAHGPSASLGIFTAQGRSSLAGLSIKPHKAQNGKWVMDKPGSCGIPPPPSVATEQQGDCRT